MTDDAAEPMRRLLSLAGAGSVHAESGPERGILTRLEGAAVALEAGATELDDDQRRLADETLRDLARRVRDGSLHAPDQDRLARRLEGAAEATRPPGAAHR